MLKPPLLISDQVDLLKKRGMKFRDELNPEHFLSTISYYRLKGYWWEMQTDSRKHIFKEGSYFEDVIYLYNFDRHLRIILFNAVERIEIALRTKLIYHMSISCGPLWHLESVHFQRKQFHIGFLKELQRELSRTKEEFVVKHKQNHVDTQPEAWKALEIVSFGTLSKLFKNLGHQLPQKSQIAAEFGLYNQSDLASWVTSLAVIRNIIAHHGRLWNRTMITPCTWPKNTPRELLNFYPSVTDRRKLFPILSASIYMNDCISPGHSLRHEISQLFHQFNDVPLWRMGFPSDWRDQPVWAK